MGTSALRERSRSRQASGSSTTSSNRSIPKPVSSLVKKSPSNQSLSSAAGSKLGPRRTPTNVEIQRQVSAPAKHDISDTVLNRQLLVAKKVAREKSPAKLPVFGK